MTVSITTQNYSQITKRILHDSSINSTIVNNVVLSSCKIYNLEIDNTGAGTPTAVYLKIWDSKNPTLGVDDPDYVIMISANVKRNMSILSGLTISNGLSYACTKVASMDDATDPDTVVQLRMIVE